jgi:hypothetical protein
LNTILKEHQMSDQNEKGQKNIEIQHDPNLRSPNLPVEAQMEKAGEPKPIERQYADSPRQDTPLTSTHDRDSVQPPDPMALSRQRAEEMPLKDQEKK